jgi:hypothetical protein
VIIKKEESCTLGVQKLSSSFSNREGLKNNSF